MSRWIGPALLVYAVILYVFASAQGSEQISTGEQAVFLLGLAILNIVLYRLDMIEKRGNN